MKSRLGVSVGLLAAAAYFSGLFSGFVPLFLVAGYILLREDNDWLRWSAVKAVLVCLLFAGITAVINLIPSLTSSLYYLSMIFSDDPFRISKLDNLIGLILQLVDIVKTIVLLLMGFRALHQGNLPLGKVDQAASKHLFG